MDVIMLFGLALSFLGGLSLGLIGGGGAILTVPVFVYVLGFEAKEAIAMGLAVVAGSSAVGTVRHWRSGNVDPGTAGMFGTFSVVGAYGGTRLAATIGDELQLALFGIVATTVAVLMFGDRPVVGADDKPIRDQSAFGGRLVAIPALGVGVLTGLLGVGGGFLIVPTLVLLGRKSMRSAVGTSLPVISANAAIGLLGYLGLVRLEWPVVAGFTAVAMIGTLLGSSLIHRVPSRTLRRAFAIFLVLVGVRMIAGLG